MAIVTDNVILRGGRGTFGKQFVLRQRNGKTVMYKMPKPYKPKTANQLANQERFAKANAFAKAEIADPEKKKRYLERAKPGQSAYNVAFRDAFHGAEIKQVHVAGPKMIIKVRNNYSVKAVTVNNKPAAFNRKAKVWEYVLPPGKTFMVRAYDLAGNMKECDFSTIKRQD